MAKHQSIYKPRIKTAADRALFFAVVIAGIFGAILLKTFPESLSVRVWAPIVFDVSLQFVYAVCVMAVPLFQLREDRAGDSFYYVGLLLTLGSLAQTLWQFGISEGSEAGSNQVISGFGLALATTIVGLALRVFVQHFRSDPVEIEHQARNTLVEAASQMTTELYSVVSEMSTFRQSMKQVTEEGMRSTATAATAAMTETATKFSTEVETLVSNLDKTFGKFEGSAENFADISKTTVAALSRLATRIDKIEPPSNVVEFVFGPARDHMIKMAETLTEAAEGQKQQIQRLGELAGVSVQALSGLDQTIASINKGASKSVEALEVSQEIGSKNAEISAELLKLTSTLSDGVKQQQTAVAGMEAVLSAASQRLASTAEGITKSQTEAVESVRSSVAALAEASARHVKEIDGQLAHAREASAKLVTEIVALADIVAEKLA